MAIADKMLRALEEEYLAIQSCNIAPSALMLDNVKPESSAADNQYQALAEDDLADAGMSDDETHSEEEISGVGSAPCKSREVQGIQSS